MRKSPIIFPAAIALACALAAGCNLFTDNKDSNSSPTGPSSPSVSMDVFAGTWSSTTASTPATGCGNVKYTVTPVSASTANVSFNATCGGNIAVNGSGTGTLSGSTLDWSANGLVAQGGVNCPFTFTNGKATQDSASTNVIVTYSGTVCGIPVSGTETVKK
jgi:Fe-S cluster assembly iron-binding protein IscA